MDTVIVIFNVNYKVIQVVEHGTDFDIYAKENGWYPDSDFPESGKCHFAGGRPAGRCIKWKVGL